MAKKKQEATKAPAVREALEANPKASAKEIVSILAGKGIKVSETYVYALKAHGKAKKRKIKRQKAMAVARSSVAATNPVELIRECRTLADKAGGIKQLLELVKILAE